MKIKYPAIIILLVICLVGSILTLTEKPSDFCSIGQESNGCSIVQDTKYAQTFGIKNSYYGIFLFSILIAIAIKQLVKPTKINNKILTTGLILGSLISLYFLYLQSFIIKIYCNYCLLVDIGILLALATQLFYKENNKP